jgi:hypothetical protein
MVFRVMRLFEPAANHYFETRGENAPKASAAAAQGAQGRTHAAAEAGTVGCRPVGWR